MKPLNWQLLGVHALIAVGAIVGALINYGIIFGLLGRLAKRTQSTLDDSFQRNFRAPLRIILPLLALDLVMPTFSFRPGVAQPLSHAIGILLIATVAWLAIKVINVIEDLMVERFRIDVGDNLRARRIRTQFEVFRRVAEFSVFIIALGIALTTFDWAKTIGASVLASAGLAGLVITMSARPALENLLAGLQIALTEPIRIEDVVIAENEWGWIEEITTTYVVVRTWDLRRLILPLSYFIKTPFQNWTRHTADLLGYVYLYLDYTMPIEPLRQEFRRILNDSKRWDRKVCVLQVSGASEHTIEVRALLSAADSGLQWDLRCEVREKLLDFVQRNFPQCLPKTRGEIGEIHARLSPNGDPRERVHPADQEMVR